MYTVYTVHTTVVSTVAAKTPQTSDGNSPRNGLHHCLSSFKKVKQVHGGCAYDDTYIYSITFYCIHLK